MIDLQLQARIIEREQLRMKILTHLNIVCDTIKSGDNYHDLESTALAMLGAKGYMFAKWQRIKTRHEYALRSCDIEHIIALDRLCTEFDERTRSSAISRI